MQQKAAGQISEVTQSQGYTEESKMEMERFKNLGMLFVSRKIISQSASPNIPVFYFSVVT